MEGGTLLIRFCAKLAVLDVSLAAPESQTVTLSILRFLIATTGRATISSTISRVAAPPAYACVAQTSRNEGTWRMR